MESHHAFSTYPSSKNRWPIFPLHGMYKCNLINKKPVNTTLSQQTYKYHPLSTIIDGAIFSFKGKFILYIYHIRNSLKTFLFKLGTNITSLKSRKTPKEFWRKWSQPTTRDKHHHNQDPFIPPSYSWNMFNNDLSYVTRIKAQMSMYHPSLDTI